jgi:hypothetical protein
MVSKSLSRSTGGTIIVQLQTTEPVFVILLRSRGIDSQPCEPVRNPICRNGPPDYIGWRNRFQGSLNVYRYGLWLNVFPLQPQRWRKDLPKKAPLVPYLASGDATAGFGTKFPHQWCESWPPTGPRKAEDRLQPRPRGPPPPLHPPRTHRLSSFFCC